MNCITGEHEVCKKIADSLGLKHCISLEIKMSTKSIVTVRAEFYPEEDGILKFPEILKDFELIEKNKGANEL